MALNTTSLSNIDRLLANVLHIEQGASTSPASTTTTTFPSSPSITTTTSTATITTTPAPITSMADTPADQLTLHGMVAVLGICFQRRGWTVLPLEIVDQIHSINHGRRNRQPQLLQPQQTTPAAPEPNGPRGDPYKPPPFDIFTGGHVCGSTGEHVPMEIRKKILAAWLPAKEVIVKPLCGPDPPPAKDPKRKGKRNKTSDIMTVCKQLKEEMVTYCYEERIFAIHVHEGLTNGGVEAFDAGRQPLQYHTNSHVDDRFTRFGDKDEFGFKKLKKVEITFYPTTEDARFTTVNTYYMSKALAGLLERTGKDNRMTSITFKFAKEEPAKDGSDRRSIIARENRWWDPDNSKPRSTALGSMSDIELVLRPFAIFDNVHNVRVELPPGADSHADTVQFASTLVAKMTGGTFTASSSIVFGIHDQAEAYMAGKREKLEAEIFEMKFGDKSRTIPNVSEEDFAGRDDQEPELFPVLAPGAHRISGTKVHTLNFEDEDDEDDDDDQDLSDNEEDQIFSMGLKNLRRAVQLRHQRESQPKVTKQSVFVGAGRTLGSSASSSDMLLPVSRQLNLQPRVAIDGEMAAMLQFREETGVGPELARDWLISAEWSLSQALKRYKGEQATSTAYSAPASTSTSTSAYLRETSTSTATSIPASPPSRAIVKEFCELTSENVSRAREYLYGAGGSLEKALARYYDDAEADRASGEDTTTPFAPQESAYTTTPSQDYDRQPAAPASSLWFNQQPSASAPMWRRAGNGHDQEGTTRTADDSSAEESMEDTVEPWVEEEMRDESGTLGS